MGILDLFYYMWENKEETFKDDLIKRYYSIFDYLYKIGIYNLDTNSKNMAMKQGKYILFDVEADCKNQKIEEVVADTMFLNREKLSEWFIKNYYTK